VVQLLIKYKANVNALDNWNWTPLHESCLKSKLDVIMCLLRNGADMGIKNLDGKTAIEINKTDTDVQLVLTGEYRKGEILEASRTGNEEKLLKLLTPLNVNCHASDGRKVMGLFGFKKNFIKRIQ
jgi:tankyrase